MEYECWLVGKNGGSSIASFFGFIYIDGPKAVEADAVTMVGK